MRKIGMAVLASILAGLLLLAALPASASAGLAGWQYQREIAVQENSGETLRDYQVPVALSGSDFPEEAEVDGDDIRFTDADGRELSYWVEEFDAGSKRAAMWVKVPLIPANGEAGITMWYGNPGAKSGSDGEAVFEFFDDFEGASLNKNKWDSAGVVSVSGGILTLDTAGENVASKLKFDRDVALRMNAYFNLADATDWIGFIVGGSGPFAIFELQSSSNPSSCGGANFFNARNYDYGDTCTKISGATGAFRIFELTWLSDENRYYVDGTLEATHTTNVPVSSLPVTAYTSQTNIIQIDWLSVRSYTSSEPTVTLAPPAPATHTALAITKSPTPHSIRQFQETTLTISIENTGTTDATDIEITDAIHPSFDLVSGDFPNPKRYDLIRPGETRDLQYTISAKESGTFTLDPASVTYADDDGNIQEAKSEPASIKVIPSTEGSTSSGTSRSNPSVTTASVQLHGEKTSVVLGEDILLKLSAVNLITKPTMHVQVIIIPPSGMSVTSSAFAKSGAGQYTTTYELEPGTGKDIEVAIRSNQVGDFDVNGRIIYYFGGDREDAEDHTLILPITVRAEPEQTVDTSGSEEKGSSAPGFAAVFAAAGVLLVALLIKRRRLR